MRRREFITLLGGSAAWPLAVRAQESARIVRIGYLSFLWCGMSPRAEFMPLRAGWFLQFVLLGSGELPGRL